MYEKRKTTWGHGLLKFVFLFKLDMDNGAFIFYLYSLKFCNLNTYVWDLYIGSYSFILNVPNIVVLKVLLRIIKIQEPWREYKKPR
jgi:hypothetical protein